MSYGLSPIHWTVRVRSAEDGSMVAPLRGEELRVREAVSFDGKGEIPSALEQFFSSYGADLVAGMLRILRAQRMEVFSVEAVVSGELENAMVHLGVVGEEGSPRIRAMSITIYVSADGAVGDLEEVVDVAFERSPLHQTLKDSVDISRRTVIS
ncbi:hypothetical protein CCB80_12680 [Armatimonadetes bacterium Uphvl-Ar1]|nr:hypothetical protein CCB80_12680 [Armatimonadetes bacterium Uphvl-Ar1]